MNCDKWEELIIDRLADELSEEETILLEQHLAECDRCCRAAEELANSVPAQNTIDRWEPDPAMEDRLLSKMRRLHAVDRSPQSEGRTTAGAAESWLAGAFDFLPTILRRPLPAYAALTLTLMAVVGGFWLGNGDRASWFGGQSELLGDSPGRYAGKDPLIETAHPAQRPAGATGSDARGEVFAATASLLDPAGGNLGFVSVQTDAVRLPISVLADSL